MSKTVFPLGVHNKTGIKYNNYKKNNKYSNL